MPGSKSPSYQDIRRSFEEQARDLVSRMRREEKVSQTMHEATPSRGWGCRSTTGGTSACTAWGARGARETVTFTFAHGTARLL